MASHVQEEPATAELVTASIGTRCANCHAPLASDQRYCLNCGERRGASQFRPLAPAGASEVVTTTEHRLPPRPPRTSATTLVAGVATLLIAMGVGVLIGHDSQSGSTRASAPAQIIRVGPSGGTTAANPAQTSASAPTKSGKSAKSAKAKVTKAPKTVVVHITPKVAKAATAAAGKVFGSSGNLSNKVTQKVNGACSGGAGCQGHKFTGNFFSP